MPGLIEITKDGSGKEDKNVESLRTDGQTNDGLSEKLIYAFSTGELKGIQ